MIAFLKIATSNNCDRIWENPPYGIFRENRDRNIYQQYNVRTNLAPSFRSIARSISEICSLLCDDARTIELEKLRSKGVAMRAHALSVYHECTYISCGRGLTIDRRSNETSERMATKTARLRPSAASFSRPLEKNFCQPV